MLVAKVMAPMKGERSFVFTIGPPAPNLGADLPIVSVIEAPAWRGGTHER